MHESYVLLHVFCGGASYWGRNITPLCTVARHAQELQRRAEQSLRHHMLQAEEDNSGS